MAWSVAGALWIGITAVSAGYYSSRESNAQCYTNEIEYSGDRLDNPIFEGGGFIGSLTLEDCQAACDSGTDSKGRPCVAIEWSDGGNAQSDSTTKSCALAWACDYTQSWGGGSVFTKEYETKNANAQCYVETTEYSGDRLDNPIFEGGGFVGTMTLADCLDQCASSTDSKGRSCVAIEWSDGGNVQSDSTTKSCALAWACDYTKYWSGGSVFPIDHYGSRNLNAQCYVDEIEYSGDRLDNPIFEAGGFIGTMTLAQCKSECTSRTDSKGRPCVAIEWSDGGNAQSDSTTKSCALAWGCDYTEYWSGGSVFRLDTATEFKYTSSEVLDGKSYEIGWIEYSSCTEGSNPQSFNSDYSMDDLIELAQSAVTVKILPSTDIPGESETAEYAVTADLCSNPIFALNHGFTMSYSVGSNLKVTGMADTDNWIGQNAHDLMRNQCGTSSGNTPFSLADGNLYWACGNTAGLHIKTTGCWFDWATVTGHDITVWLGFDAESDRVCVEHDDGRYGLEGEEASAHLVVQGRTSWSWGSAPDYYCQSDDDNQAAYTSSKHGRNIGVGCCSMDGTTGYRPSCKKPATYQEAVDLCSSTVKNGESLRLCTRQEMLYGKSNGKGITEGTGCWFDAAYQWVADECDVGTDAAAAITNDGSGSNGEGGSFDDFVPMILGAAAGIAVIAGIVTVVVAMRKKNAAKETVSKMNAVHVPDESVVTNTAKETAMEVVAEPKQDVDAVAVE